MKALIVAAFLTLGIAAGAKAAESTAPLEAVLQGLAERHGFALQMADEVKGLPVAQPQGLDGAAFSAELLERLLRPTSHVLVRDGERVVRVIVLAPATAAPDVVVGIDSTPLSLEAARSQLAEDRRAVAQGLAPDTGRPTGLQAALQGAMEQADRERDRFLLLAPAAK